MFVRVPSDWRQTANASPPPPTATWGKTASPASSVLIRAGAPQRAPGVNLAAQMLLRRPSDWYHTASPLPASSKAIDGDWDHPSGVASRLEAGPQPAGPAGPGWGTPGAS